MPPISPTYIGEKTTPLFETYGIQAIGNTFGEHMWNLMGTHWEFEKNIQGTCLEQKKNEKNPLSHPQIQKKIKSSHF